MVTKNYLGYFEKIFCINLAHRQDRKILVESEFKKMGIEKKVIFYDGIISDNGHFGCLLSHRSIVLLAKEQKLNNVLVFEDDIEVIENNLEILPNSINDLKSRENWGMFYLGCSFFFQDLPYLKHKDGLFEVHGGRSTHAIAYNKQFYDVFLEMTLPEKIIKKYGAIDVYFAKFMQEKYKTYMPIKPICKQRVDFSNIENRIINLDKNILDNFFYLSKRSRYKKNIYFVFLRKIIFFVWSYSKIDLYNLRRIKTYLVSLKKQFL